MSKGKALVIAGKKIVINTVYTITKEQFDAKPKMVDRVTSLNGKRVISIWSKKDLATKSERKKGIKKMNYRFSVCEWPEDDEAWMEHFTLSKTIILAKGAFTVSEQSRHYNDPLARFREKHPELAGTKI